MSHDMNLLIASELEQLNMLVETRRPLVERSIRGDVSLESLDALSALLHSAYTAMERIMTHVAKKEGIYEELRSRAYMWHTALLNALSPPDADQPGIISEALRGHLSEYLGFRHVFRHAYLHELQWGKMRPLVENLEPVVRMFESEINDYLRKHP